MGDPRTSRRGLVLGVVKSAVSEGDRLMGGPGGWPESGPVEDCGYVSKDGPG